MTEIPALVTIAPAPVRRDPGKTRRRILAAARDEFCERGLDGARVDAIAERAKINKRMLYHYFGAKQDLYSAVLHEAYTDIRVGERRLLLEETEPAAGMEELIRFTFRHFVNHPWFIRLLINENLHQASTLAKLKPIRDMHSPLVGQIDNLLSRGAESGVFRKGIDPIELYISIAALGFFYLSNIHTLSVIFSENLKAKQRLKARENHAVEVIMSYVRSVG